jgi:C4-dicarboxylate transporter/malic acid transport protein
MTMFKRIVKNFGPEWGAALMGTAALSITMQLSSEVARPLTVLLYVGLAFYLFATVMFVLFLIPWTLRFFMYPDDIKRDLSNPIRSNFFPTMPITIILAGTATNKLGPILFGPDLAYHLAVVFFFIGSAGIFIFGWLLIRNQFVNKNLNLEHANFSWFIPPVSHLIIPVLGVCSMDVHWAESSLASLIYIISFAGLGIGLFSFLFVGAAIWHRYIYTAIPAGRLAATTMIGTAPTSIMVIFLVKFSEAVEAGHGMLFGMQFETVFPFIQIAASVLWGFSLWWLVVTIIMSSHYFSKADHPVVFAIWAYTFPFEAFVVATGLLAKALAAQILHPLLISLNIAAVIVWAFVVFATIKWLHSGAFFDESKAKKATLNPAMALVGLVIIFIPLTSGSILYATASAENVFPSEQIRNPIPPPAEGVIFNDLQIQWTFYPALRYKPLLVDASEYLVFVFHFANRSELPMHLTPSYTFTCPPGIRRAANEEIASYIEDAVEKDLGLTTQVPMSFTVPSGEIKHYLAVFECPRSMKHFGVDIKLFQGYGWRLHYENHGQGWIHVRNTSLAV